MCAYTCSASTCLERLCELQDMHFFEDPAKHCMVSNRGLQDLQLCVPSVDSHTNIYCICHTQCSCTATILCFVAQRMVSLATTSCLDNIVTTFAILHNSLSVSKPLCVVMHNSITAS